MSKPYKAAAKILGWRWEPAYDGYIHENRRNRPGTRPIDWDSYEVAEDAEEACFWDGIETEAQAMELVDAQR
ncbi:hypothetical protein [Ochrobactrum soli]|uniref:Uncharacterized protein n=1 Tax=Ochrobactrum soli TaxID=2448455 RepID=A0A849KS41_9HYPH|nr:hypothetical protein [[Ochrobactrum] soli]NNU59706.1 hypothetical protein [[Ochrobactrum] soli]